MKSTRKSRKSTRKYTKKSRKSKTKKLFKNKDYNSKDGMLTSVWGPSMWHTLHTISFNYPCKPTHTQKKQYMNYMKSLVNVLPCGACRDNLKKNYKTLPINMSVMKNRNTFSRYVYKLHELVNNMLNKKSGLSYDDVRTRYEYFRARCNDKKQHIAVIENGCVKSLYGLKSKCVLRIVPQTEDIKSFDIDKKCNMH